MFINEDLHLLTFFFPETSHYSRYLLSFLIMWKVLSFLFRFIKTFGNAA
ncbi:MAG: hypothetical protein ACTS8Y_03765 [Arsenophonus sp. ER-EMS1-MAG3]